MNRVSIVAAAALLLLASSAAHAQPLATIPPVGLPTRFNWPLIEACAKDPKHRWQAYCRSWLDAREEGKTK